MDDERNLKIIVCSKCGWRWGERPPPLTKVFLDYDGYFVCPREGCGGRLVKEPKRSFTKSQVHEICNDVIQSVLDMDKGEG